MVPYFGNELSHHAEDMSEHYLWTAFKLFDDAYQDLFGFSRAAALDPEAQEPELSWVRKAERSLHLPLAFSNFCMSRS